MKTKNYKINTLTLITCYVVPSWFTPSITLTCESVAPSCNMTGFAALFQTVFTIKPSGQPKYTVDIIF